MHGSCRRRPLFDLPLSDQLQLVEDRDHIGDSKESLPVPDWRKKELDRHKHNFEANPGSGIDWEAAKNQIRRRYDYGLRNLP